MINLFLCILSYESLETSSFCCLRYGFDLTLKRSGRYKIRAFLPVHGISDSDPRTENTDLCYLMKTLKKPISMIQPSQISLSYTKFVTIYWLLHGY